MVNVIFYLAADNNLDIYAQEEIKLDILKENLQHVNIYIFLDRRNKKPWETDEDFKSKRLKISNGEIKIEETLSELNTGNQNTLSDFLIWCNDLSNLGDQNILVIWGHGGGYSNYNEEGLSKLTIEPSKQIHWIAYDASQNDALTIPELKNAIKIAPQKFNILAFDACLMGNIETYFELVNCTDIIIASQEIVDPLGFPYGEILGQIEAKTNTQHWAYNFVNGFIKYSEKNFTLSAINQLFINDLFLIFDQIAKGILNNFNFKKIEEISKKIKRFKDENYVDLLDLVMLLQNVPSMEESLPIFKDFYKKHHQTVFVHQYNGNYSQSHGISIFFPKRKPTEIIISEFLKLDVYYKYPNWLKLINHYFNYANQRN